MKEVISFLKSITDTDLLHVVIFGERDEPMRDNGFGKCPCVYHALDLAIPPYCLQQLLKENFSEEQFKVIQEEIKYRKMGWSDYGSINEETDGPYLTKSVYPKWYRDKYGYELYDYYKNMYAK